MRGSLVYAIVLLGTQLPGSVRADGPTLTHLKPAGMQRGTTRTIECFGQFEWPLTISCPGATVKCLEEKGKLSVAVDASIASDRIWIRLHDAAGASDAIPLLVGELPSVDEVEPNNAPDEAQAIPQPSDSIVACTIDGVLEKNGDVDGYSVELAAGETLVAVAEANTSFGAPMDAILQVALPDGTVVDENHDFRGLDPGLAFKAKESGTYVVRIFAWPSQPNQQIRYHGAANFIYRLTLTTGPYITHALDQAAFGNGTANIRLAGWNLPVGAHAQAEPLSFLGQELEFGPNDSSLANSSIGFVRAPGIAGSARIRILEQAFSGSENSAAPNCTANSVRSGLLDKPNEEHVYFIELLKDQSVEIAVDAVNLYSELVPSVTLHDPTGKVVKETSERGAASDESFTYKAPTDGQYKLTVRDRFGLGGPRHFYRLSIAEPLAGFSLATISDRFVVTSEKALEIPITVTRKAAAQVAVVGQTVGDIHVSVEGLPDGTQIATAVSSEAGETSKKVTLTLTTDGRAFSGPIRIIGRSVGNSSEGSEISRAARTPARFGASFEQHWLTVVAKE